MSDKPTSEDPQPNGSSPDRPAPPPFRPHEEWIGYIERGQRPPVRPAAPSKKR